MKKLMSIVIIFLLGLFTIKGVEAADAPVSIGHAIISVNYDLPVYFVKGNENLQGDKAVQYFKNYFSIRDQRKDVEVKEEYLNIGTFDINVVGEYEIKLSFVGRSTLRVSEIITVYVIEEDTLAPEVYILRDNINYNVTKPVPKNEKESEEERVRKFIKSLNLTVRDNVDGLIELTEEHFTGVAEIDSTNLNGQYEITLTVSDSAGNTYTKNAIVTIKDITGPVIYNPTNVSTRRNKPVEYKNHVVIEDNFNEREELEVWYTIEKLTYEKVDGEEQIVLTEVSEVDFSKLGEFVITVHAKDTSGNLAATKQYKVIIENGISLPLLVFIINGVLLLIGGALVATFVISHKKNQKGA
ncbi:MAG: hypothetical protein GX931_00190 [Acholeplasmataceae bacterium]|jgi:hypothetical protein|nr:hypothetical protein [Acholeplasmataceae bacterium]